MRIGVPKEIKVHEYRVGMTPVSVREAVGRGHEVLVETNAALRQGFTDDDYRKAGATILGSAAEIFATADMIVKVKEPQASEWPMIRKGQTVFTYFHFAADRDLTEAMINSGAAAVAYETLADDQGRLPLLTPMSEVAGRMSVQEGAKYLERPQQGRGILLGGVPGVAPANILILGGGIVGANAAKVAAGFGACVRAGPAEEIERGINGKRRPRPWGQLGRKPHHLRHLGQRHAFRARRCLRTHRRQG